MSDDHATAAAYADRIEAAMREAGLWRDEPLDPERYEFREAFGADTMSFDQWLQYVFLDRVRQIVAERGQFPAQSMVATQAIRELDGHPRADRLLAELAEFDAWIEDP